MCKLFEKVHALHLSTQDPFSTNRDATLHALSKRLYKFEQYARKVNCGDYQDTTAKALLVAYIMGSSAVTQRKKAKFASMDSALEADSRFYKGLWNILCEVYAPESATIAELPPLSDNTLALLTRDPDVIRFSIQDICDDYVNFCIFNDYPYTMRTKAAQLMNLPPKWVSVHYLMSARDGRVESTDKLLEFMFGLFRLDYLCKPAPRDTYWNEHAYLTWQRIHYVLRDDLKRAETILETYIREDTGRDKKSRRT